MPHNNNLPFDEQISLLASQHHRSEYNRSKYGHNGSPLQYQPMSLYMPEKFRSLRQKQLSTLHAHSWWPAPPQAVFVASVSLQDEIMEAMSEPIVLSQPIKPSTSIRTSQTHPINISPIIPPDLIALISSHAVIAASPSTTFLTLPPALYLDRLIHSRDSRKYTQVRSHITTPSIPDLFGTRSNVSNALQMAISSSLHGVEPHKGSPQAIHGHISELVPEGAVSIALSLSSQSQPSSFQALPSHELFSVTPDCLPDLQPSGLPMTSSDTLQDEAENLMMGNLLLSSCPGKKVRLDGPVKGRSGVCRDLESDFRRMKELNVACVICCLDDEELEFLGSPWAEYSIHAQKLGIDILRVPIPEGLPPLSPSSLDSHIDDMISRYTLKGISILVHCRGGVGRAGVIACCWMMRLGLCGWPGTKVGEHPTLTAEGATHDHQVRFDFIARVIAIMRRRRSAKAIETYEQVKFLFDYVEYLETRCQSPSVTA